MTLLPKSLSAWQTPKFSDILKQEITQLPHDILPLQQALLHGNMANSNNIEVMILSFTDNKNNIQAKVGIFFTSTLYGCQCADDPSPANKENEYCELIFSINKKTSSSTITLIS